MTFFKNRIFNIWEILSVKKYLVLMLSYPAAFTSLHFTPERSLPKQTENSSAGAVCKDIGFTIIVFASHVCSLFMFLHR